MACGCAIITCRVFSDRGSISRLVEKTESVDASAIKAGGKLPGLDPGIAAVVEYYDGECLEVSCGDKSISIRSGDEMQEIYGFLVDNPCVQESVSICLRIDAVCEMASSDYPEMFRHGSFNAIVRNFLISSCSDSCAQSRFIWTFTARENLFLLDRDTVSILREYADKGNLYALFGLGRYHCCVQPEPESGQIAEECIRKAYEGGLAEAGAALALLYRSGIGCIVDRSKAYELLDEAIGKDCSYAMQIYVRDVISDYAGDPEKAIGILDGLLEKEEDNPGLHGMRGWAVQCLGTPSDALDDYAAAIQNGQISAYLNYAVAASCDEELNVVDEEAFQAALELGIKHRDAQCIYVMAMQQADGYDSMDEYGQYVLRGRIQGLLEKAAGMGLDIAAETLGDIFFDGRFGFSVDKQAAMSWYERAGTLLSPTAYEKMFRMMQNGDIEADQHAMDMCALKGARLGSDDMIFETVAAFSYDRLNVYCDEIAENYVPIVDARADEYLDDEDPDDEDPDDGRYDAYV